MDPTDFRYLGTVRCSQDEIQEFREWLYRRMRSHEDAHFKIVDEPLGTHFALAVAGLSAVAYNKVALAFEAWRFGRTQRALQTG